jgi:crotonobetainyl-CoA:carnitine CoA-transferase CaiB-like acyl-CoA transferase
MLTLMMADHGADVIKIEPPGEGEPARHLGAIKNGASVWFRNTHRGKRSIQLDLKSEAGLAAFDALAHDADVIVEAFRPGVASRLRVDYARVRTFNPSVVYCALSAFGQSGAYRERPAHDLTVQALAGIVSLTEGFDGKPAPPGMTAADAISSLTALSGILMALLRRTQTGRGDHLDIAMLDSLMAWTPSLTPSIFASGEAPVPKHERGFGGQAMNALYACADGRWIVLGGSELKFARNLLEAFGRIDLLKYAALGPGPAQAPLADFLRAQFRTRSQAEWVAWFEGRDICFAPVRDLHEAFADPSFTARGMLSRDAEGSEIVGTPLRFEDEPGRPDPALPQLNEHAGEGWRPR